MVRSPLAVVVLGLACAHPSPGPRWAQLGRSCPADAPVVEAPPAVRDSLDRLAAGHGRTQDDRWADLSREVPGGFAGIIANGRSPYVLLVDTTRLAEATAALEARGAFNVKPRWPQARKVRWSFAQLYDWYRYLNGHLEFGADIATSDIDEGENRLSYGVMGEAARRRLERRLARLVPPPPCFLVAIEVVGPPPEKAVSRVPARIGSSGDTAAIVLPASVRRGEEFSMTVPTFGGGCIRDTAATSVSVRGLRARVTFYHVRRQEAVCFSDRIEFRQTVRLRFDQPGLATIEVRGVSNGLDFADVKPRWVVPTRHVVVD